jgi:hypothetical protein
MNPKSLRRTAAVTFALALGAAAPFAPPKLLAAPAEPAAAKAPAPGRPVAGSNTIVARRVVRVVVSMGSMPDLTVIAERLKAPEVAGAIGAEVLGISKEDAAAVLQGPETIMAGNLSEISIEVNVDPKAHPNARPAAKEFADRLVARLSELVAEEQRQQETPRVAQASEWYTSARQEYDSVVQRMREKQAVMGGQSPEGLRATLAKLEDERQRLELELAGMQARQKAVEEWIDKTSRQIEVQLKEDPVVAELEKAVAAQEQVVKMTRQRFESGVAPQTDLAAAEAKLSDVKITLLDRRRGPAAASGSTDPLAALTRELQTLSIDTVDRKARLTFVEKRIAPLREAAAAVSDFELIEAERAALRKEVEQARQELRSAERASQATLGGTRVVVIKSQDTPRDRPAGSTRPE